MTKFLGLVAAVVAALGVTLATPASSKACGPRCGRSYYVEPCCTSDSVAYGSTMVPAYSNAGYTVVGPEYSSGYYPTWSGNTSGYYPTWSGNTSGYYRVGNVIINGRRWGDIGYRYSHADLVGW